MARTAGAGVGSPVWRRAETAAYVEAEGRAVVLDLARLELAPYVFEGSAAQIWALIDGRRSEADVVAALAIGYEVAAGELAADVGAFTERLRGLGLLVSGVSVQPGGAD